MSILNASPPVIASYTTAANVYFTLGSGWIPVAGSLDMHAVVGAIEKTLREHPALTEKDFIRLDSPIRGNIEEARSILMKEVLEDDKWQKLGWQA